MLTACAHGRRVSRYHPVRTRIVGVDHFDPGVGIGGSLVIIEDARFSVVHHGVLKSATARWEDKESPGSLAYVNRGGRLQVT